MNRSQTLAESPLTKKALFRRVSASMVSVVDQLQFSAARSTIYPLWMLQATMVAPELIKAPWIISEGSGETYHHNRTRESRATIAKTTWVQYRSAWTLAVKTVTIQARWKTIRESNKKKLQPEHNSWQRPNLVQPITTILEDKKCVTVKSEPRLFIGVMPASLVRSISLQNMLWLNTHH